MRRALTRATAVSTAMALALSLLTAPSALADEDDSTGTDPSSSEEERDALALAEETGERVEIAGLTDEKTQHFANPDGTLTMETHAVPVRVRSNGGWVDADPSLVATEDGLVRPRAAGMDIAFSGGGDAPMAEIGIGSNSVELGWTGDLPEPVLDGAQATYADVLPDVDLVLTAGVEGFTQVLVVHTPEAAEAPELAELQLALGTEGVTVTEDEHGNLEAVGDQGGQGVFAVQAPAMWDSAGAEEAVESEDPTVAPLSGSRVEQVETTVGVDSIRLVPDQAMLADEATEYPVYIDPSVSANRPNWGYVDKAYPNQEYFNPTVDSVGVGRIEWDRVYTRRAFFQFTTMGRTEHSNTIIHSATLRTEVDWAYDCNSDSHIQLHRVDRFNSNTTWNNQPTTRTKQDEKNVTGGWATCPSSSGVEFDATNAYQWGLDNDEAYIYLRLKEQDESGTTAWRRFDTKNKPPVLVVDYNHPPEKPTTSTISDSLGGVCQTDREDPRLINDTSITLRAQIRDRDSYWVGQQVKAQFEWKLTGVTERLGTADSAYVTVAKWSGGSYRSTTASDLPEQQLIAYRARGHDKTNWGPWSSWCFIEIDTSKPDSGPEVTSTDYPAGDEAHGSVGRTGDFTFTNDGVEDASAYHYSVNDASCSTTIDLDSPGAEATVPITPHRDGPNLIHARISDAYGNSSECGLVYTFTVAPPTDPASYFPLDEGQGTTAADMSAPDRTADTTGTVDWTRGRVGERTGSSYRLEGTAVQPVDGGHLRTEGPVIDTSGAFTVSAWVRLDEATGNHTAVSQDGDRHSGFYLGYNNTSAGNWVFKQAPFDGDETNIARRVYSTEPAELGVWTHLMGTHDPETGELVLYVDGVRQGEIVQESPWNAEGPLVIGGAKYKGQFYDAWPGAIDDVRVLDRVLTDQSLNGDEDTPSEAWTLANRPTALEGRWQMDETEGTAVADSSDHGLDGTLHGDPMTAWNQALNDVTFAPGVSLNAEHQEHITTDAPAVRTDRSYSVAAWVRLDEVGHNATAVSQDGNDHSAFYLSYQSTYEWNNWVMKLPPSDETGATGWHRALSDHEPEFGRWTHLAATYDHTAREATLYIDGVAQGTAEVPAAWHAGGSTVIGGARFEGAFEGEWEGDISDVHLYQGVLDEADIARVYEGFLPLN
ncbi:concanavalin A-like lectin/glucanase superfamily protein [Nocardiopsis sp. Huas11]|uniref:LamG-like jellyroll fold domain-containing protein n=1 Tax=Nocardiopsis sp. Huas11 TaxID=2183912 RepID=UPI000EB5BD6D|nr:LamG-like jellyroll fold domain-containing protein [Nocardiopsis sp. Huas11]RKS05026.1 concanavalin A-like lectin/glucanase superfamily protein [Nocardiopsis sp. Huas11]